MVGERTRVRCNSCLAKAGTKNRVCSVCGIAPDKKGRDLSPREKRVRRFARAILGVAALHLVGFGLFLHVLLVLNPRAAHDDGFVFSPAIVGALAAINLVLAFGLARYAFWAYRLATAYYFLIGIVNIVSVQVVGILWMLILLYLIGNGTAKALFERRTADAA